MKNEGYFSSDSSLMHPHSKFFFFFILLTGVGCAGILGTKIFLSIINGDKLSHVAGAWVALAIDLKNGIFYRPLFSETIGFGGTRFFPLFFSFHALLIRLFGAPVLSGHIVSLLSGSLLLGSSYLFLRRMELKPFLACVLSIFLLASSSVQLGLSTIRGDVLPLALNICGFLFFLSKIPPKYREALTSVCFILAFSAKMTAVNGIAALFLWLLLTGRVKEGSRVLLYTLTGYALFLSLLYLWTSGRIVSIFQTCSTGGASLYSILHTPIIFAHILIKSEKTCLLLLILAIITISKGGKKKFITLPGIFWGVSLLITIIVFGSPGINYNHLIDLTTATMLLIGSSLPNNRLQRLLVCCIACIVWLSILYHIPAVKKQIIQCGNGNPLYPKNLINLVKQTKGEILSEDPFVPILANKSPYILDAFMLRLIFLKNVPSKVFLLNKVKQKMFSDIIFMNDDPLKNTEWYSNLHFGSDFMEAVFENYKKAYQFDNFYVYQPR